MVEHFTRVRLFCKAEVVNNKDGSGSIDQKGHKRDHSGVEHYYLSSLIVDLRIRFNDHCQEES